MRLGGDIDHQGLANIIGPGRTRRGEQAQRAADSRSSCCSRCSIRCAGILQVKDSLSDPEPTADRPADACFSGGCYAKQDSIWAPVVTYLVATAGQLQSRRSGGARSSGAHGGVRRDDRRDDGGIEDSHAGADRRLSAGAALVLRSRDVEAAATTERIFPGVLGTPGGPSTSCWAWS